jgi:hypothetical protein
LCLFIYFWSKVDPASGGPLDRKIRDSRSSPERWFAGILVLDRRSLAPPSWLRAWVRSGAGGYRRLPDVPLRYPFHVPLLNGHLITDSRPSLKREGFAIGRMGNAAMPTGSTLGQSDIMRQARKLLITAPLGLLTLVSRPSNAISLRVSSAELRLGDRRRSGSAAVQCRLLSTAL